MNEPRTIWFVAHGRGVWDQDWAVTELAADPSRKLE